MIKQYKEKNISVDAETMALVTEVRKSLGMIHKFSPNIKHSNEISRDSTELKNMKNPFKVIFEEIFGND